MPWPEEATRWTLFFRQGVRHQRTERVIRLPYFGSITAVNLKNVMLVRHSPLTLCLWSNILTVKARGLLDRKTTAVRSNISKESKESVKQAPSPACRHCQILSMTCTLLRRESVIKMTRPCMAAGRG
jgi:hypothetical protein